MGYVLENESYLGLPPLLRRDHGIEVVEDLKRDYVFCGKAEMEVNIIGKGRRQGRDLWILGECKTQLTKRDIDTFLRHMERVRRVLPATLFTCSSPTRPSPSPVNMQRIGTWPSTSPTSSAVPSRLSELRGATLRVFWTAITGPWSYPGAALFPKAPFFPSSPSRHP